MLLVASAFIFLAYVLFDVNYYIRGIVTLFIAQIMCTRRRHSSEEIVTYGICLPSDLDMFCHMNNARYLREFEFARSFSLIIMGMFKACRELKGTGVLSAVSVRYRRSISLFQVFRVRSKIVYWKDKDFYMEQHIETIHDSFVRAVCLSRLSMLNGLHVHDVLNKMSGGMNSPLPEPSEDLLLWIDSNQTSSKKLRKETSNEKLCK